VVLKERKFAIGNLAITPIALLVLQFTLASAEV
jgi:hypothetical protein